MMIFCPFCGRKLQNKLKNGITTCGFCQQIFHTSSHHLILSAAWLCRRWHLFDIDKVKKHCELTDEEAAFVQQYVLDLGLPHDELLPLLSEFCRIPA